MRRIKPFHPTPEFRPAICATDQKLTAPWLVDANCKCTYKDPDTQTECQYELAVLACFKQFGYDLQCAKLPPLPVTSVIDTRKSTYYYEEINVNTYFPGQCGIQDKVVVACLGNINATNGYSGNPVYGQVTHHCNTALDPCYAIEGPPNFLGVFDPCSTQSCFKGQ